MTTPRPIRSQKLSTNQKPAFGPNGPSVLLRYMTREEVNVQLQHERQARINAETRESFWKEKFANEAV